MSERLTITLSDENYKLLKDVSATTKNSMSKILNILTDVMLDKRDKNFYKVVILNRDQFTRLFVENQEISMLHSIEFKQTTDNARPFLNITKVSIEHGAVLQTKEDISL